MHSDPKYRNRRLPTDVTRADRASVIHPVHSLMANTRPRFPLCAGPFFVSNNALIANEKPRRFGGTGAFGPGNSQGAGGTATPRVQAVKCDSDWWGFTALVDDSVTAAVVRSGADSLAPILV
jgi:hypothetical protein